MTPEDKGQLFAEHWRQVVGRVPESEWKRHLQAPRPPRRWQEDSHALAAASVAIAILSFLVWPLGFVAIMLAWKATRRGSMIGWPEIGYAIAGAVVGACTAALTCGLAAALLLAAAR